MANLKLEINEYLPLRDLVYETLRNAILKGELKPGERLMEMTLASKLGVSRTPVREAIRRLEQDGLAIMIPRRGARVAKMTIKDMDDVYAVRRALETLALQSAVMNMTPERIAELRYAERVFEEAVLDRSPEKVEQKDAAFHGVIHEASGNSRLVDIMSTLSEQISRYRWACLKNKDLFHEIVKEHRKIVDALEKNDYEAALKATMDHLTSQENIIKDLLREEV